jgi:hypothetical protein
VRFVNPKHVQGLVEMPKFAHPEDVTLWTFGSPAVANQAWAASHNSALESYGARSWRVTNLDDWMPHMFPTNMVAAPTITDAVTRGEDPMQLYVLYESHTSGVRRLRELAPHAGAAHSSR